MIEHRKELITPEVAKEFLSHNEMNRKLRPTKVTQYAKEMEQGTWTDTCDPIKFDSNNRLIDGQHRLHAIIQSGCSQMMSVVRGLPPETANNVDRGLPRALSDCIQMNGLPYPKLTGTIALMCWKYQQGYHLRRGTVYKPSHSQVLDFIEENPKIFESIEFVARATWAQKIIPASVLGMVHFYGHQLDSARAAEFLYLLDLPPQDRTHPCTALMKTFISMKANQKKGEVIQQEIPLVFMIKAFNLFMAGKSVKLFRWVNGEQTAEFHGYKRS